MQYEPLRVIRPDDGGGGGPERGSAADPHQRLCPAVHVGGAVGDQDLDAVPLRFAPAPVRDLQVLDVPVALVGQLHRAAALGRRLPGAGGPAIQQQMVAGAKMYEPGVVGVPTTGVPYLRWARSSGA